MRITVELRTEPDTEGDRRLAAQPGQRATLSGPGWKVPVSIRAISASSSEDQDETACRLLGPGYVLDDDAEEWAVVMVTYGGHTRLASSFLPPGEVQRLLRLGLEETARMIDQERRLIWHVSIGDSGRRKLGPPDLNRSRSAGFGCNGPGNGCSVTCARDGYPGLEGLWIKYLSPTSSAD